MRSKLHQCLLFRLGLLALFALAPAALIAVSLNQDYGRQQRAEALRTVQVQAERIAGRGREVLAGAGQLLHGLSSLPVLQPAGSRSLSGLLRDATHNSPDVLGVDLYTTAGRLTASSGPGEAPASVAESPWLQDALAGSACTQAEFSPGRDGGPPALALGCPVLDGNGRLAAVLGIRTGLAWFHEQAAALGLPSDTTVCLVDAGGEIRAHFPSHTADAARYIPDARAVMAKVGQGTSLLEEVDQDGVRRIYAYSQLSARPGRELYVRVGFPTDLTLAGDRQASRRNIMILLVCAAGLAAAGLVARTILKPTQEVLRAVRAIGAGELGFRIRSRASGELGEMADAVDAMAEALQRSDANLRESELRLRQFLEDSQEGYFVSSIEGRFLEANTAHVEMLGYDSLEQLRAELTDISRRFYVDPRRREALMERLQVEGRVAGFELEAYRRNGATIWVELTARALRDEQGNITGVQGFSTDITERRQMEMELKRSNERFLRVLENQADAIFVADAETDLVLYANKAVRDILARDRGGREILGRPCWEVVHGGRDQCRGCPRQGLLDAHGEPQGVYTREEYDPATDTWSLVRLQGLRWVDGRQARMETITDITAIKRAQEELRATSGHLRGILENSPTLITIRDREGRFLLASKRIEEIWGHPAADIAGRGLEDVYPATIAFAARKEDRDILDAGLPLTRIADVPMSAGRVLTLLITKFPLRDQHGVPDKVCTIATDITERVRLERELRAAKEAAEEASRAKSDFLAKMSHELRTPLNAVLGFSELAGMSPSDAERVQALDALRDSGRTLLALFDDILDLSRVETGSISLARVPFEPRAVVEDAARHLAPEAEEKGLRLSAQVGPEVPERVLGDPARLRQIIVNLAANAVKFTPKGSVDIFLDLVGPDSPARAKSPSGAAMGGVQLLLRVHDTGIGIPEDVQHLVFENFSQADGSTSRTYGGTGLGLAICRQFARFMGGDIWLASEPGEGSTFFVTLPFGRAEATTAHPASQSPGPDGTGRALRVLLVEDTPANTVIATAFLKRLGHACSHAANGQEALELLRREPFDLVLMDVEMPFMDGLEATRRLRAGEAGEGNRFTPVLAMTAHALPAFRDKCAEAGMNGFVTKPLGFRELAELLAGSAAGAQEPAPRSRPEPDAGLLDLDAALALLGGQRELLAEVVDVFLAELPDKRQALARALEQGDLAALRLAAHSLKSSCASVGANPASRAAEELESAARDGRGQELAALRATLEVLLESSRQALAAARPGLGGTGAEPSA